MCKKEAVDAVALLERIAELSPRQQEQVANFVEFLYQKYVQNTDFTLQAKTLGEVYPPGAHIQELLEEQNMTEAELSVKLGLSEKQVIELLHGELRVSSAIAQSLEEIFKVPSRFWLNLEELYADYKIKKPNVTSRESL